MRREPRTRRMQKEEFLELFAAATRAAKSARERNFDENSAAVSRCVDAMKRLKEAPESLACHMVLTASVGKSYDVFFHHNNPRRILSEAKLLWDLWLSYLYATGRERNRRDREQVPVKRVVQSSTMVKKKKQTGDSMRDKVPAIQRTSLSKVATEVVETGDSKRDKVREILQASLSKVATEVVETETKKRVVSCDPWTVAVSVESAMFEKLGCFEGPQKPKYRSILFNMGDSNNPDLRRKVLLGEISGARLVTMEKEELGSDKIQMEVQKIKERAKFREENRIKMMLQSDMIMT